MATYLVYRWHCFGTRTSSWPSNDTIVKMSGGYTEQMIMIARKKLVDSGWLVFVRWRAPGVG